MNIPYVKAKIKRSIKRVVSICRMRQISTGSTTVELNEILLFLVVRNKAMRLPYLFEYYFSKGVDRIFVIDNGSTDVIRYRFCCLKGIRMSSQQRNILRGIRQFGSTYFCDAMGWGIGVL